MSRKKFALRKTSKTSNPAATVKQVIEPLEVNTFKTQLLTPKSTAQVLAVPLGTLSNWRNSKRACGPPFVKIGHSVRYRMADLDQWIAQNLVEPRAGAR